MHSNVLAKPQTIDTDTLRDSHRRQKKRAFGRPGRADQVIPVVEMSWTRMSLLVFPENRLIRIEDLL